MATRSQPRHVFTLATYIGFHLGGYPSGSLLKDGDSPTMAARSQPRQVFTLATRVNQQPTQVFTLTIIPQESLERWGLTH